MAASPQNPSRYETFEESQAKLRNSRERLIKVSPDNDNSKGVRTAAITWVFALIVVGASIGSIATMTWFSREIQGTHRTPVERPADVQPVEQETAPV